jgi:hypothetical protein
MIRFQGAQRTGGVMRIDATFNQKWLGSLEGTWILASGFRLRYHKRLRNACDEVGCLIILV